MIEEILERQRVSTWDFRSVAHPQDPLTDRFGAWVEYYRLKAAIAAVLRPASILEIGVRYGYSYAAFKHGHPAAHYVGIDLDSDSFGGVRGAIDWARQLGAGTEDRFLVDDTQGMDRFPGGTYDLIHVDGQQDGQGSFHDLTLAISQGRYVLVDGYLWTRDNCLSVSDFMLRYRDVFEYALVVPGYAGELLIKVKPEHLERETRRLQGDADGGSASVREHYTSEYFTKDCGGWEAFERHRARRLDNVRLQTLLDLALVGRPQRLLDLGCGRGEITYQAARRGMEVTAVDYSQAAIEIARSCFEGERDLEKRVEWICGSAADLSLHGEYDVVVAGDLVEHLSPTELDRVYATVRRHLAPDGRLIVHTFPNAWFYRYHYARQRRTAASVGAYLPADPRSRYEKLMHINEQSPRVLRRQLQGHFPHVLQWFLQPDEPAGNLVRAMSRRELAACRDLYAVASLRPIDVPELLTVLAMAPLTPGQAGAVEWTVGECPAQAKTGSEFAATIRIENRSGVTLHSHPPCPVNLCYHWRDAATGAIEVFDGRRTPLDLALRDGEAGTFEVIVQAPPRPGDFLLDVTLVQEHVRWFECARPTGVETRRVKLTPIDRA